MPSKDELQLPEGWQWDQDWLVDMNRGVDDEGTSSAIGVSADIITLVFDNVLGFQGSSIVLSRQLAVLDRWRRRTTSLADGAGFASVPWLSTWRIRKRRFDLTPHQLISSVPAFVPHACILPHVCFYHLSAFCFASHYYSFAAHLIFSSPHTPGGMYCVRSV